jgi:hypothetical protein
MTRNRDDGSALILALMAAVLLALLGAGLVLLGSTEGAIAANFRASFEARYAAEAAAERALQDLLHVDNWGDVLSGATPSTFVDGTLTPTLASGQPLDLAGLTTSLQRESDLLSSWGANNPQWRLFLYGPLSAVTGTGTVQSQAYLVAWVGDDPAETDGNPLADSNARITLIARAIGLFQSTRLVEVTLARLRPGAAGVRVLSWREVQ